MRTEQHLEKASRLGRAISALSPDVNPEAVAELAMVTATHLVNALCHADGLDFDIVHSDLIELDRTAGVARIFRPTEYSLREATLRALASLKRIEELRRDLVRGPTDDPNLAMDALTELEVVREMIKDFPAGQVAPPVRR